MTFIVQFVDHFTTFQWKLLNGKHSWANKVNYFSVLPWLNLTTNVLLECSSWWKFNSLADEIAGENFSTCFNLPTQLGESIEQACEPIFTRRSKLSFRHSNGKTQASSTILTTGNILRPFFVTIISFVRFWKRHHSSRSSRFTIKFRSMSRFLLWLDRVVRLDVTSAFNLMSLWSLERSESSNEVRLKFGSIDDRM